LGGNVALKEYAIKRKLAEVKPFVHVPITVMYEYSPKSISMEESILKKTDSPSGCPEISSLMEIECSLT
jgi:hypothetical protein